MTAHVDDIQVFNNLLIRRKGVKCIWNRFGLCFIFLKQKNRSKQRHRHQKHHANRKEHGSCGLCPLRQCHHDGLVVGQRERCQWIHVGSGKHYGGRPKTPNNIGNIIFFFLKTDIIHTVGGSLSQDGSWNRPGDIQQDNLIHIC